MEVFIIASPRGCGGDVLCRAIDSVVQTDRYSDHHGALKSMFNDCGFEGSTVTTKDLTDWGA